MIITKKKKNKKEVVNLNLQNPEAIQIFSSIPENGFVKVAEVLFKIHKKTHKDLILRLVK